MTTTTRPPPAATTPTTGLVHQYVSPAVRAQQARDVERDQGEAIRQQHKKVAQHRELIEGAKARLYQRSDAELHLAAQVRTNHTNAGITNEGTILAAAEAAIATVRAGGKALPPPNYFREAKTRYGTEPARHVVERQRREGKL